MENIRHLKESYSQTPWRKQVQGITLFLAILVFVAVVAAFYLHVTAKAVTMGNEIQNMQKEIDRIKRVNADLEAQLAYLTSVSSMTERAREMGFRPVGAGQLVYIKVTGYPGRNPASIAPVAGPKVVSAPTLSPAFTESLLEWITANILTPSGLLAEGKP